MNTLEKLCNILDCTANDVVKFEKDWCGAWVPASVFFGEVKRRNASRKIEREERSGRCILLLETVLRVLPSLTVTHRIRRRMRFHGLEIQPAPADWTCGNIWYRIDHNTGYGKKQRRLNPDQPPGKCRVFCPPVPCRDACTPHKKICIICFKMQDKMHDILVWYVYPVKIKGITENKENSEDGVRTSIPFLLFKDR